MERVRTFLALAVSISVFATASVRAGTVTWQTSGTGDWFDATNWLDDTATARVPTTGDFASIDNGGNATISTGTANALRVTLGTNPTQSGTLTISGGTLQLDAAGSVIGVGGTTGGTSLGGTGTFIQSGDSVVFAREARIGISGGGTISGSSVGTYLMQGGTLAINGGAGDFFALGSGLGATGVYLQTGGFANVGNLYVGRTSAAGSFTLSAGTFVTQQSVFIGGSASSDSGAIGVGTQSAGTTLKVGNVGTGENFRIGFGTGTGGASNGTYNMNGGTIAFTTTSIGMIVGDSGGNGTLNMSDGSLLTRSINVGRNTTGVGTVNLSGGTMIFTGGGVVVGGNAISNTGPGGTGTFIQTGGYLQTDSASNISFSSSSVSAGTYLLQGGTVKLAGTGSNAALWAIGNQSMSSGTFIMSGGTFDASTGTFELTRSSATAKGYASLQGGFMSVATLDFGQASATHTFSFTGGTLAVKNVRFQTNDTLANNGGTFSPGGAGVVGTSTFVGNESYSQSNTSKLAIDLASASSFDFVSLGQTVSTTGNATIDGTIAVQTIGGFDPVQGTTFDVLLADLVTLNPSTLVTGTTPSGKTFDASVVGGTTLRLTVTPEPTVIAPLALALPWLLQRRRRKRAA